MAHQHAKSQGGKRASALASDEWVQWGLVLKRFESAWQEGLRPVIEDHLDAVAMPAGAAERRGLLLELVHLDLEYRWKAGDPTSVEEYLARYPELGSDRAALLELAATEKDLRQRGGRDRCAPTPMRPDSRMVPFPAGLSRLGKYELQELVGRGSFGVVFRAHDTELDRAVAIKIPRLGHLASQEEIDRFLREARSAAQLKHPHIVAVYDASQTGEMAYLVSEFIPGRTLAEHLGTGRLGCRRSAGLVAQVAEAVHYAHQRGVIHRDLKPANLLLDETGQAHIMDFGLAKRDHGECTLTLEGAVLGTAAHMSPEQALGKAHQVDGRSDVYSLGVILYELLTGELPFHGDARMVLAQVLDERPRPPRRLDDRIPRDLEIICLKCLEKQPHQRYADAAALAGDLHRFLRGEPISARPTSALAHLGRWCRRKPLVAALAAGLVLVFVAGFAGVTWQWRRAESSRQQAEDNFQQAFEAMNTWSARSEELLVKKAGTQPLRRQLLTDSLQFYERLLQDGAEHAHVRHQLATNHLRLGVLSSEIGQLDGAQAHYQQAVAMIQEMHGGAATNEHHLAATYFHLACLHQEIGHWEQAQHLHLQALAIQEQLAQGPTREDWEGPPPSRSWLERNVAQSYRCLGDVERAFGHPDKARGYYEQARTIQERLVRENGASKYLQQLADTDYRLGLVCLDQGRPAEALPSLTRARAVLERVCADSSAFIAWRFDLGQTDLGIGLAREALGQSGEALQAFQQARCTFEQLVRENPTVTSFQRGLAEAWLYLGNLQCNQGQAAEAVRGFEEAGAICQRLLRDNPAVTQTQAILADSYLGISRVRRIEGQNALAQQALQQARAGWKKLVRDHPDLPRFRTGLAKVRREKDSSGEVLNKENSHPSSLPPG